mgnify:CR=1 FL=1
MSGRFPSLLRKFRILAHFCRALLALVWVLVAAGALVAAEKPAAQTGAIEGTVTYRADTQRPWRYSRYYIKNAKTGELAEAVVALRGKTLADAAPKHQPETASIDQKNFQFTPETTLVRVGDSVTFTNSDDAIHNVRASVKIASFNVNMPPKGSHTIKCDKAGGVKDPIEVGCIFHSAMRAWVFVFDHPYYQLTGEDGRFRLEGIPPGSYDLEMRHPAGELRWREKVTVRPGETLPVDIVVSPDEKD